MFCKNCGNPMGEGEEFCKKCGTRAEQVKKPSLGGIAVHRVYLKAGIVIASLLMALSTALPFYRIHPQIADYLNIDSISLLYVDGQIGNGIILVIFAGLLILFTCMNKRIPVLILGILSFLTYGVFSFVIWNAIQEGNRGLEDYFDMNELMYKGSGHYLMLISVIVLLICCVVFFVKKDNA